MSVFSSLFSIFGKEEQEAFGDGERLPLTKQMIVSIKRHMTPLKDADLSEYTFERRRSDYSGAKSDLVIYSDTKQAVLHGREPGSGPISFWAY